MLDSLFSKGKIGNCEIKNRLVVTAMVTNYCNKKGEATERYIRYHEEKAKGGWGLIVTEDYGVMPWPLSKTIISNCRETPSGSC